MDLVSREWLLSEYDKRHEGPPGGARKIMEEAPTIQPPTGKWIERECGTEDKQGGWPTVIVCSQCDFPATTFYSEDCESRTQIKTRFCPHCGARMVME